MYRIPLFVSISVLGLIDTTSKRDGSGTWPKTQEHVPTAIINRGSFVLMAVNTVGQENGYMLDENRMEKRRPRSFPGGLSATRRKVHSDSWRDVSAKSS
jgi:hypothetical protein